MQKESHPFRKKIMNDLIWNFGAIVIARMGGLIFTILAARLLMPEGFGEYNLAISVAFIFMTFADLGINSAFIRYVSSEIGKNKEKAAEYYHYLLRIKIYLGVIVSVALLLSSYILANYLFHKPELFPMLMMLSLYNLVITIGGFYECGFIIVNKVGYVTIKETLFQLFRIITLILAVFILAKSYYVLGAIAGLVITMIIAYGVVIYFSRKALSLPKPKDYSQIDKKRILKFIGFLTLSNMSMAFFSSMDIVMLGIFVSSDYIGYYRSALGLIFAIIGTLNFSGIFLSALTKVKHEKLQIAFDRIVRYSLALLIPAIVGIVMLAKYIMLTLYGYDYLPSAALTYYLVPLILLVLIVNLFLALLSSRERTKEFAFLTLACLIINIILNYLLIKMLLPSSQLAATNGVAIATLVSWIVYAIGTVIISKKQLNVTLNYRLLFKPILSSIIMGIFLYIYTKFVVDMTPMKGVLEVLIGAVIYLVCLLGIGGIKKVDIDILYRLLLNKFKKGKSEQAH